MPNRIMRYKIDAERLVYWFFRLNGFLTIENFILHHETRSTQRTDLDLVGVRYPHRREALHGHGDHERWMEDFSIFANNDRPLIVFVEVCTRRCKINGPWTAREKGNLPRALRALGIIPESVVTEASNNIYDEGHFLSSDFQVQLVAIGKQTNAHL